MTLGSWARRTGFWLLDDIKGGPVRRQYEDVESKMSSEHDSSEQLLLLLDHAVRTTPFYSRYSAGNLQALPVVNRAHYRSHFGDFQSKEYVGATLHRISTSGSTGTPLTIGQDAVKR